MFKNLTWRAAAKLYIAGVGLAATAVTANADLPAWVPVVVGVATLVAGWLKRQYPEPTTIT